MIVLNDRKSIRDFIKQNNIKDFIQLNDLFKKMMGVIIEEMLEAERDEYLGYQRYQLQKILTQEMAIHPKQI